MDNLNPFAHAVRLQAIANTAVFSIVIQSHLSGIPSLKIAAASLSLVIEYHKINYKDQCKGGCIV